MSPRWLLLPQECAFSAAQYHGVSLRKYSIQYMPFDAGSPLAFVLKLLIPLSLLCNLGQTFLSLLQQYTDCTQTNTFTIRDLSDTIPIYHPLLQLQRIIDELGHDNRGVTGRGYPWTIRVTQHVTASCWGEAELVCLLNTTSQSISCAFINTASTTSFARSLTHHPKPLGHAWYRY